MAMSATRHRWHGEEPKCIIDMNNIVNEAYFRCVTPWRWHEIKQAGGGDSTCEMKKAFMK